MKKTACPSRHADYKQSDCHKRRKVRFDTGKPTLTQQGIDVDTFIHDNHALIQRLRKGTH